MATYHVDLLNGNDSNDGLSWANAWKEISGHDATLSDTDTVKVAKTGVPISLGSSAWTNKSNLVTIPTAKTEKIDDCIGNTWTSALGTANSYSSGKLSTTCQNVFSATTAIGKLAYKKLTELNLSAYNKVSFWYGTNIYSYLKEGDYSLCLCSDEAGDAPVHTIDLSPVGENNTFDSVVFDNGSPLHTSIKSIALYKNNVTLAMLHIRLNNIFACNDLTLHSVIGKSSNPLLDFYPIQAINGTSIYIDQQILRAPGRGYYGDTESIESFFIIAASRPMGRSATYYKTTKSGKSKTERLKFSGGWNKSSNEQDGITVISGGCCAGYFIYIDNNFISFERFIVSGYATGINGSTLNSLGSALNYMSAINCIIGFSIASGFDIKNIFALNNYTHGYSGNSGNKTRVIDAVINNNGDISAAFDCATSSCHFENISLNNNYSGLKLTTDKDNTISGNKGCNNTLINITGKDNQYGLTNDNSTHNTWIDCEGTGMFTAYNTVINNKTYLSPTSTQLSNSGLTVINLNGVIGAYYYGAENSIMNWQTDIKREDENGAWRLMAGANYSQLDYPILDYFRIAEIAVEKNVPILIKVWVLLQNDTGEATLSIRRLKSNISLTDDLTATTIPIAEWQQVILFINPTKTGIITLEASLTKGNFAYIGSIGMTT
ncbi:hypothetical protein [Massilibacteroides sp.]|uniref:hypothetical protein n=1 Tax=Massilibacteroides sp. TaxID=2034766 RepID=UPI0026045734|nr:hypothetical protein [Massilibacteroides sp.]MDD4515409.1 hypothetical protein [Massilibacteroides sp.]